MSFINQSISKVGILRGIQVLVVDNDRDSQYLYATLLKGCGANVVTATSVEEAIDVLDWLLPNILICETRFFGESIGTLTTKLSEMRARGGSPIPTIAITTWISDTLAQILDLGFEGYLLKPIDLDQLVSMIRHLVVADRKSPPPYSLRLRIKSKKRQKAPAVIEPQSDR
ncbi:MAG: response regulator [Tildeniella nuda ZEHNDER 1965/U140]|jgi:CheY-like chemotaxis protein|nr:response regulator [Tildeniella nuda ZEHNDER 1965/U140]